MSDKELDREIFNAEASVRASGREDLVSLMNACKVGNDHLKKEYGNTDDINRLFDHSYLTTIRNIRNLAVESAP